MEEIMNKTVQQTILGPAAQRAVANQRSQPPSPLLHQGKVNLEIVPPVDLIQFMKLRTELKHIPQLRILHITSSQKKGGTISTLLTEPIPLIGILNKINTVHEVVVKLQWPTATTLESHRIEPVSKISITLTPRG